MVFCSRKKIIFIHIPRCGGTSVERALNMFISVEHGWGLKNDRAMHHYLCSDYISLLGRETFYSYYKFAIVRNPYTRLISEYHWCPIKGMGSKSRQNMDDFINDCRDIVEREDYYRTTYHDHMMPQHKFIYDANYNLMVDEVFYFERYDEVASMLNSRFDASVKKYQAGDYDKSLTLNPQQKERVYNIYKKDFELLGYEK